MSLSTSTPAFPQPARSNLLVPVIVAFFVLGMVIVLVLRFTPQTTADLSTSHTIVYPIHTEIKGESIAVGSTETQDDLYVFTNVHVSNRIRYPIFLKDFTATITTEDGEQITTSAVEKDDLPNLFTSYPALKPFASTPLLRETVIDPGQSADGTVILHFPITQSVWDHRRTAVLDVDLYHEGDQYVPILRSSEITKPTYTPPPGSIDK
ncbi:hypothetical protein GCM10011507_30230 [Edaphobacter acidisoli]|uniref:Uncharacterized protein n=1 Tax=Edaphobacter acidisoli TaxID=2040573 RepID=A0A916RZE8_9BACT|nr:hypothetical protein [Edaphobacter acidisoli]GGA76860.1 hypothetical protein GCM10011507_30230 [Edaphobacter acidisoli]